MAASPEAGWYADPGDATRYRYWDGTAWTDKTRPATGGTDSDVGAGGAAKTRRRRLLPLAIAAGGVLVVGAGAVAIVVLNDNGSTPQATSPTSTPSHDTAPEDVSPITDLSPWEVFIPSDWQTFVSRSGAIEYSYDPTWTDVSGLNNEQAFSDTPGLESTQVEIAGTWMVSGSALSGGTSLMVMAFSDGSVPILLPVQTEAFARSNATAAGGTDYTVLVDAGFTTGQGYEAWRVDYTMDVYGVHANQAVIGFISDVTMGFIYVSSIDDFDVWLPDLLSVADSLVVVKPPVSL